MTASVRKPKTILCSTAVFVILFLLSFSAFAAPLSETEFDSLLRSSSLASRWKFAVSLSTSRVGKGIPLSDLERFLLARVILHTGNRKGAKRIARPIKARVLRLFIEGETALTEENLSLAVRKFTEAGKLGLPEGYYAASLVALRSGNPKAAKDLLLEIPDPSPLSIQKKLKIATCEILLGNDEKAWKIITGIAATAREISLPEKLEYLYLGSLILTRREDGTRLLVYSSKLESLLPHLKSDIRKLGELTRFPEEFPDLEKRGNPYLLSPWFRESARYLGEMGITAARIRLTESILKKTSDQLHRAELYLSQAEAEKKKTEILLERVGETLNAIETSLGNAEKLRSRITRYIDEVDVFSLLQGKRWNEVIGKIRKLEKALSNLEILMGEVGEKAKRTGSEDLTRKLSEKEKTLLKKAVKRFYELEKEATILKAEAGLLRARLTNLAKGPVIRKALSELKQVKKSEKRALALKRKYESLRKDLLARARFEERKIAALKRAIEKIAESRKATLSTLKKLENLYREQGASLIETLNRGTRTISAEIHHLRGRAYLHMALKGVKVPGGGNAYALAGSEFKKALSGFLPKRQIPEALYALGEITMTLEEEKFAEKMEEVSRLEKEGKDFEEPRLDYTEAFSYFKKLIEEYPDSPYLESALYSLAYGKNEMGFLDESVELYEKLIEMFPRTRYADEINLRIAEYYFNSDEFPTAERFYRKVRRGKNIELYLTARFKLGWSLYNQDRFEEAISAFITTLKHPEDEGKLRFARLADESIRMIAKCFIELSDLTGLADRLEREGLSPMIPRGILEEEKILFESSRFDDVLFLASYLKKNHPLSKEILESEQLAARSLIKTLREEAGHRRMVEAAKILSPGSRWFEWNEKDPKFAARAEEEVEKMLREGAYYFYKEGKKKRSTRLMKEAINSFRVYLKAFPTSEYADDVRFDLAMSLFRTGSYRSAARIFASVFENTRKESLKEPSLYMAVQSLKATYRPGKKELALGIVSTGRKYVASFPSSERVVEVLLDVARALFNEKMFEEAVETARSILERGGKKSEELEALRIEGDSLFNEGKYSEAEKTYRSLLSRLSGRPVEERRVSNLIALCILKNAQLLEKEGRLAEAGREYERVVDEFPAVEFSPLSALSGAKAFIRAGLDELAEKILGEVINLYPGTPFEQEGRRLIARIFEKRGEIEKAAENYRLIGEALSKKAEGVAFLRKAGKMYYEMGSYERASRSFERVLSSRDISPEERAEALYFGGKSLMRLGKSRKGRKLLEKAVNMGKGENARVRYYASLSLLELTAQTFEKYRNIKVQEPFVVTFKKKEQYLKKLIKSYLKVARFGIPETLSQALFMIGESYEEFKNSILDAPIPKGLTQVEQEEYIFLLEEKAAPFEEKAVETHESNVRKAARNGYVNRWVKMSLEKLEELRPALFGRKPENPPIVIPIHTKPEFPPLSTGVRG